MIISNYGWQGAAVKLLATGVGLYPYLSSKGFQPVFLPSRVGGSACNRGFSTLPYGGWLDGG